MFKPTHFRLQNAIHWPGAGPTRELAADNIREVKSDGDKHTFIHASGAAVEVPKAEVTTYGIYNAEDVPNMPNPEDYTDGANSDDDTDTDETSGYTDDDVDTDINSGIDFDNDANDDTACGDGDCGCQGNELTGEEIDAQNDQSDQGDILPADTLSEHVAQPGDTNVADNTGGDLDDGSKAKKKKAKKK